jgi:Zn-dependent peptidase ImmA (M78 family)
MTKRLKLSWSRAKRCFPDFNVKPISENDAWRFAKRRKIIVRDLPLQVEGYYQRKAGRDYILLNSRLSEMQRWHTLLHELGHYIFDEPCESDNYTLYRVCDSNQLPDPRELRADAFALIAMMPFEDLLKLQLEDLSHDAWLANQVVQRLAVYVEYGM